MTKLSAAALLDELICSLNNVPDPRVAGRSKHLLIDILVLTVLAFLCGAEGITEIEGFGHEKEIFLRKHLKLPGGIPSHDTIARVLSIIKPEYLELAFSRWVSKSLNGNTSGDVISLNGKSVNGTERDSARGNLPLHLVSAYSHSSGLALCQSKAAGAGMAEASAALECLRLIDLKGLNRA